MRESLTIANLCSFCDRQATGIMSDGRFFCPMHQPSICTMKDHNQLLTKNDRLAAENAMLRGRNLELTQQNAELLGKANENRQLRELLITRQWDGGYCYECRAQRIRGKQVHKPGCVFLELFPPPIPSSQSPAPPP